MKFVNKIFIFELLLHVHPTPRCITIKRHLESPCIGNDLWRWKLGLFFLQGLFICSCFITPHSNKSISPEYIITGSHHSTHQYNQLALVTKVSIMNKQGGATSSLKPSDMMSDRQPGLKLGFYLLGGRGKPLFLRFLISFSQARSLTLNNSILCNIHQN